LNNPFHYIRERISNLFEPAASTLFNLPLGKHPGARDYLTIKALTGVPRAQTTSKSGRCRDKAEAAPSLSCRALRNNPSPMVRTRCWFASSQCLEIAEFSLQVVAVL
jgi:hypothetical protein